jgi:hypothetical protein
MIAKLIHWVRKRIEIRKREREVDEEFKGYFHARKLSEKGTPLSRIEQEVEDRIYFSRRSGHFEKGMLRFLENKKGMDLVFQERRNHEHE